ncbi:MAG TPA: arylamine N-acetyltransferase [Thermoanaerobaculia bacterium]|nr:arylamine N-acetyltransferase [Thermoanaerobaculia bacterium]
MIPADEILEALDLSRARPGAGFLEALFARFIAKVPFENASKIVRHADVPAPGEKPRRPGIFWKDHLALGTGGTCFARVAAFDALLTELGFRTRRVLGRVRRANGHAALIVEAPGGETIADVGYPLPALVPAKAGLVETPTVDLRVEAGDSWFEVFFDEGVPEGNRSIGIGAATAEPEAFEAAWRDSFRDGALFLQEVSLRRDLGNRVLSFARGQARVDDRCSRLTVPLPAPRAAALSPLFDVDEALLARAFALAGDPGPAETDAVLTAYLETDAALERAYAAVGSREGYAKLLSGVAEVRDLGPTERGFRLSLSAAADAPADAALEEDVSLDDAARRVAVRRRAGTVEQRSAYRVLERDGRRFLVREATLSGAREDLLRNDSLRGRFAANLAVDLLAWARML